MDRAGIGLGLGADSADHSGMAKAEGSAVAPALHGRAGNVVFVRGAEGVQVRPYVVGRDPRTEGQIAARGRMRQAGEAWRGMTVEQASLWRDYAESLAAIDPATRERVVPRAQLLFSKLAVKFLQVNPGGVIPLIPPVSAFVSENIEPVAGVDVSGILISSMRANSPGVRTEILIQPLASVHRRSYLARYRSAGFYVLDGAHGVPILVPPGAYAVAVRFVVAATGQESEVWELGTRVTT